jgi:DNA-binding response OmpR family regulator
MKQKHILIIDDEIENLRSLECILRTANYKITAVSDINQALYKILKFDDNDSHIDLIITDIFLGDYSGIDLIDALNRIGSSIPVFAITGNWSKDLLITLLRKGCDEYLDKPIDSKDLLDRVQRLFNNKIVEYDPVLKYEVERENGSFIVTISAQEFAPIVELGIKNSTAQFSDNYFHLLPGEKKKIKVTGYKDSNKHFIDELIVTSSTPSFKSNK